MANVKYKCPDCGQEFERYADYILPGVEGTVRQSDGKVVIFADPTAIHRCDVCCEKALAAFIENVKKENSNAENCNSEN